MVETAAKAPQESEPSLALLGVQVALRSRWSLQRKNLLLNLQLAHCFSSKISTPKTDCLRNPFYFWWRQLESEPRPASGAASCPPLPMVATEWRSSLILAACTWLLIQTISTKNKTEPINRLCLFMVETVGIEPMTSCMSSMRSNQLSYASATDGIIPYAEGFVKGFLKSFFENFWFFVQLSFLITR